MTSIRASRSLARVLIKPHHAVSQNIPARRLFNSETAPSLYAAHATVVGGRNGHVKTDALQLDLAMPTKLGGAGNKTNPEELFAAGYGACFQSAMGAVAPGLGIKLPTKPEDSVVESSVHLVGDMKKLDLGLRVELLIKVNGMSKEDIKKVVDKTKETCPYSRATAGNVHTTIKIQVDGEDV